MNQSRELFSGDHPLLSSIVAVVTAAGVVGAVIGAAVLATGCVDPFRGSNIQVTFQNTVPATPLAGMTPELGAPPENTFFSFYAVDIEFQRDSDGGVVVDDEGNPVILDSTTSHVADFEIRPVINAGSPCFIEVGNTDFPGLHVSQFLAKVSEVTGITDPTAPPPDASPEDLTDVLGARRRMALLPALQMFVKAVTSSSQRAYPGVGGECIEDGGDPARIPPPQCTGEDSNRARLENCQRFWDENPSHYEGSDKVFTIPIAGDFFGTVVGLNPANMGVLGGAGLFSPVELTSLDVLRIHWQFKDLDQDGAPDFPDDFPDQDRSDVGVLFMQGVPVNKTRGVINIPMGSPVEPTIVGEAVIVPDLGGDEVNF